MASSTPVSMPARITAEPVAVSPAPAVPATAADAVRPAAAAQDTGSHAGSGNIPGNMAAAVEELVDVLKTTSIGLRFEIDDTTHRVITKVVDKETGELIRQLPSEEVLRFARAIDKLQGLFVSHAV
ncbi:MULTISPECIES: flagellar protein FlaG [unclassified Cupriavidus]|uniref:flagellar protein FlaG n=1 Tax=unclassified Cupriavidus TaxID=2640874 RepID=UPI001C009010|nr:MULTISPECIES: flagellar protein FlaG [unclassified Cupriavidus]MCA3182935.1 flagellar protein FlaG [Cupriavidus sp.]MCA3192496.1 flagellar protein FlaG [Cupriavidus sp.]MCA3198892.1 flagellar protein FlaG [Cupriavidus sp.]MCA3205254.1 flagellar protein FlaG [Cupriavidus sp.]MCA3207312.1 flagellar protein FlaG [Cupriavidus sp.]